MSSVGNRVDAALARGDMDEAAEILRGILREADKGPAFVSKKFEIRGDAQSGKTTSLVNRWMRDRGAVLVTFSDNERMRLLASFGISGHAAARVWTWAEGVEGLEQFRGVRQRFMVDESQICPAPVMAAMREIGRVTAVVIGQRTE
jgi:hypothetical protein